MTEFKAPEQRDKDTAYRFMQMKQSLDSIRSIYNRNPQKHSREEDYPEQVTGQDYLVTHLNHWLSTYVTIIGTTRSGLDHKLMVHTQAKEDGRRSLPRSIRGCLHRNLTKGQWGYRTTKDPCPDIKVTLTWVVCYIQGIVPDASLDGWQTFECSHRCAEVEHLCLDPDCLFWESRSANQSRGYGLCWRVCTHCGRHLCECQQIHVPPCI